MNVRQQVRFDSRIATKTYVSLGEFQDTAHARNVDDTRSNACSGRVPLGQQVDKGRRYEEDRERVDAIETAPPLEGLIVKQGTREGARVFMLRSTLVIKERGHWTNLARTTDCVSSMVKK